MKKISIMFLVLAMTLCIAACGRNNNEENSVPSTILPETTMPFLPEMDPTLDTNIPDPDINTEMPTYTDGTDPTDEIIGK